MRAGAADVQKAKNLKIIAHGMGKVGSTRSLVDSCRIGKNPPSSHGLTEKKEKTRGPRGRDPERPEGCLLPPVPAETRLRRQVLPTKMTRLKDDSEADDTQRSPKN
jgi:hypothetical protein